MYTGPAAILTISFAKFLLPSIGVALGFFIGFMIRGIEKSSFGLKLDDMDQEELEGNILIMQKKLRRMNPPESDMDNKSDKNRHR